jgi:hypothetical protein
MKEYRIMNKEYRISKESLNYFNIPGSISVIRYSTGPLAGALDSGRSAERMAHGAGSMAYGGETR